MAGKRAAIDKSGSSSTRRFWVIVGLGGSLTATALFLQMMSPPPLAAQGSPGLFAQEQAEVMTRVVAQPRPAERVERVRQAEWKYIYIHHSKTADGDVRTLAHPQRGQGDHFLIGNGAGAADGEIQISQRWDQQLPPLAPAGAGEVDGRCISICIVGDFGRTRPTAAQLEQLGRLVNRLQAQYSIPTSSVYMGSQSNAAAGIGVNFPVNELRQHMAGK
jgi:hypothetical protein